VNPRSRTDLLHRPAKRYLWVWCLWLLAFYATWSWLVWDGGLWQEVTQQWPIALAMALGSFAAGSTPMGGGTVGFPVLVLLFDLPAALGRDFSFAVQSIGMTSASIFILARRQPLAFALLKGALLGCLLALPVGVFLIAPRLPDIWIKLVFAVAWGGFGLLHLYRIREIAGLTGMTEFDERWDFRGGLLLGALASATIVAASGVGVDMVVYAALVLMFRADLKIAIPTSVVIMAFASVYGSALKLGATGMQPGVFEQWLAAAPVVALGAPLGVFVVERIGRAPILLFVAALCVGQLVWTLWKEYAVLGPAGVLIALIAVGILLAAFEGLRRYGAVLKGERGGDRHHRSLGIEDVQPHVGSKPLPPGGD
jgi:uncharacterized membrane protein YfcA